MMPNDIHKLRQLEEENRQLKKLAADFSPDKQMLQEVLIKWSILRLSRSRRHIHVEETTWKYWL